MESRRCRGRFPRGLAGRAGWPLAIVLAILSSGPAVAPARAGESQPMLFVRGQLCFPRFITQVGSADGSGIGYNVLQNGFAAGVARTRDSYTAMVGASVVRGSCKDLTYSRIEVVLGCDALLTRFAGVGMTAGAGSLIVGEDPLVRGCATLDCHVFFLLSGERGEAGSVTAARLEVGVELAGGPANLTVGEEQPVFLRRVEPAIAPTVGFSLFFW